MNDLTTTLERLDAALDDVVASALRGGAITFADDSDVLRVLSLAAGLQHRAEALQAAASAVIDERSARERPRDERMTTRHGARTAAELVQRVTRCCRSRANDVVAAGRAGFGERDALTGEERDPRYPAIAHAFRSGSVGIDGLLAVTKVLGEATRVDPAARLAADAELAAAACGDGPDGAPGSDADGLRQMAHVWLAWLDPDGAEPTADDAQRRRGVSLGRERNGLVHLWGDVLPEVGAQLQLLWDSILNPAASNGPVFRAEGEPDAVPPDPRTRAQRQHDALATVLTKAAASGALPSLGGAAPTLVVWAREEDLVAGRGIAHLPGQDSPSHSMSPATPAATAP